VGVYAGEDLHRHTHGCGEGQKQEVSRDEGTGWKSLFKQGCRGTQRCMRRAEGGGCKMQGENTNGKLAEGET
jgi:hypothetical protein